MWVMGRVQIRGETARRFIIENVGAHPADITRLAIEKLGCTRQAVNRHLQKLVDEGALTATGKTRTRKYSLASLVSAEKFYVLGGDANEGEAWRTDVAPLLGKLPENAMGIWQYGFTEMFNNAIDHSGGTGVIVKIEKTAASTEIVITDNGVGIFKKIHAAMGLLDERHAVLELAKGKFTTDPANHSGEGIFFSSRMFDEFEILSGGVYFSHEFHTREDWILQPSNDSIGTLVRMRLNDHTSRTTTKVFDKFASGDEYAFAKTIVPVKLMRYGDDNLVSRSQAKRLLARFERFKVVMLNFSGVATIGQAFADEVFRVFKLRHPEVELVVVQANSDVKRMISRAQAHDTPQLTA